MNQKKIQMAQKIYFANAVSEMTTEIRGVINKQFRKFKILSISLLFIHLLFAALSLLQVANAQTYAPVSYWTFNSSPFNKDSMNRTNMDFTSYGCGYTVSNNSAVGKGLILGSSGDNINTGNFVTDTSFAIEFLFKPGYQFNQTLLFRRMDGGFSANFNFDGIYFYTYTSGSGSDELKVSFDGIGKRSYGYFVDGNWHHIVFQYSSLTGKKEIYIDGECPSGYSKNISGKVVNGSNTSLFWNQGVSYMKYFGEYDEIAIYNRTVPAKLIYQHYKDAVQTNKSYSFNLTFNGSLPSPSPISAGLDNTEFAPGHPNPNVSAIDQLRSYPVARYKAGNTLMKNFNWVDLMYMGGRFQSGVSDAQSATNSTAINEELAKNWNYMIQLRLSMDQWGNAWANLANQNPQLGTSLITLRAQLNPSLIRSQNLSSDKYLQNSSGNFIDPNGNNSSTKWWRPTAPANAYSGDGNQMKSNVQDVLNALTRPLTMINENGEVFAWSTDAALSADPAVVAAKNASGLDFQTFQARKFKENETQSYRDIIMDIPALSNTKFTEYGIDGFPQYRQKYSEARLVNSEINGQRYSTPDFYPRWPHNWRNWITAWHGWQWIVDSRYYELQAGDNLFSPFVAAGWDVNEDNNMRPAQFMGLLKCLNMIGAEFFYTGYFNEAGNYNPPNPPPANPAGYAWQTAMPSYAQAVASRYEEFLRNGSVMPGDVPAYYSAPSGKPGYTFWAGDLRKLVVVRKHNTQSKFAITGTIQPNTSMVGGAENESVATITLDGQQVKFKVRRQGSTYIYDKTNASSPVFYQLDEWHEKSHPSFWSKDFTIESELYDNTNAAYNLKTIQPQGAAAGDYSNFTTAVVFPSTQTTFTPLEYVFQPRSSSQANLYLFVRARSTDGTATGLGVSVDNGASKSIGCVTDTNWTWYRLDACSQQAIQFTGLSIGSHTIRFAPTNNKIMIDKFILSANNNVITNYSMVACNSGGTATINASGPTTFCQGGSVTLTAGAGNSYLWSNGATTQSITVSQAGNYVVTVSQGSGCAAISNPVAVSVSSAPAATISANGSTSLCQGASVTLTASAGSTYQWSNGATSQSITVNAAGNYVVTVSNAQGCSATSAATNVTMTAGGTATITAGGPTTFCPGGNVTLTANTGTSYLWSTGATTKSITVNATGSYSVTVNNGSCSATSAPTSVTVSNSATATITANGPTTFCPGSNVTLTANAGSSYQWSNGATTQSITVSAAGSYSVTVSNGNCSATSAPTVVTVSNNATATITAGGPTSFCQGGSVTLTANTGSSYLWSNGATTKSITVNASGSYSVTVSTGSCSATSAPKVVTVSQAPNATITAGGPTSFCQGGSVTLTSSTGTSYLWSNGATTKSITVSTAGSYVVTVSNGSCSAASAPQTVAVAANPTATITPNGSTMLCSGASVVLKASSGTSYLWSTGATTQSITVSTAGSYTVKVYNAQGCVTTSAPIAITTGGATATIIANGPTTFCQGGGVTLSAGAGTSYQWSNGATTQDINVSTSGSYVVTVSNGSCSATSAPLVITVNPLPAATITASGSTTITQGQSVTLTASSGSSYLWSTGATTSSITVNTAGSYTVKVTNAQGCSATSSPMVITVVNNSQPASITTTAANNQICMGQSATLTSSPGMQYIWLPGLQATQSIVVNAPGTYTVNIRNSDGTTSTANITISQAPTPNKPEVTYTYVTGTMYQLKAFEPSAASYLWNGGQTTSTISVNASGIYSVVAKNAYGCQSPAAKIQVNSLEPASCAKPDMLSAYNIIDKKASLMWNPAVTADSFRVAYNKMGSTTVIVKYVRSRNNLDINELLPATTYQWNVTAICAGSSVVSATEVFTTLNGPTDCGSTVVNTFTTNVTNSSAQLNWYGTRATNITIRYKKLGASSYTYKSLATNNTTAWGFNLTNLVSGTTYQWSVKTECGSVSSNYSSDNYFTTTSGCDVISGITISNVASNKATVSWNPQSGVRYVLIRYAPATSNQWKYIYANASTGNKVINNLTPGVAYKVQLKSMCTYSNNSAYSAMERFTTGIARLGEATSELMINAYPNPADAHITYAFDAKKEGYFFVRVSDIAGRILLNDKKMASEGVNGGDIDLRLFTPGVYTLTITKGSEENHIRFEVNR